MKYDLDYYENLLRRYSRTAEAISAIRWKWLEPLGVKSVLDYGSGVGWFRAYRPEGVEVDTWDVGPYPTTGMTRRCYDVVTFWDVLEHVNPWEAILPVFSLARYIAGTVPAIPNGKIKETWKHYKPGEHVCVWGVREWTAAFAKTGWKVIRAGKPECPPRQDIMSFICERKNGC